MGLRRRAGSLSKSPNHPPTPCRGPAAAGLKCPLLLLLPFQGGEGLVVTPGSSGALPGPPREADSEPLTYPAAWLGKD